MTDFQNDPAFQTAVDERVRQILRAELNDYIQTATILPSQIRGERNDGTEAQAGDVMKYDDTNQRMEVAP